MRPVLHLLNPNGWQPALPTPDNLYLESLAWKFIASFREGILRNSLEGAFFKIREISYESDSELVSEKYLCISHNSWKDYSRLIAKWKTLSYRVKRLNPEIAYLWLQDPDQATSILIDLKKQKAFNLTAREGGKA